MQDGLGKVFFRPTCCFKPRPILRTDHPSSLFLQLFSNSNHRLLGLTFLPAAQWEVVKRKDNKNKLKKSPPINKRKSNRMPLSERPERSRWPLLIRRRKYLQVQRTSSFVFWGFLATCKQAPRRIIHRLHQKTRCALISTPFFPWLRVLTRAWGGAGELSSSSASSALASCCCRRLGSGASGGAGAGPRLCRRHRRGATPPREGQRPPEESPPPFEEMKSGFDSCEGDAVFKMVKSMMFMENHAFDVS